MSFSNQRVLFTDFRIGSFLAHGKSLRDFGFGCQKRFHRFSPGFRGFSPGFRGFHRFSPGFKDFQIRRFFHFHRSTLEPQCQVWVIISGSSILDCEGPECTFAKVSELQYFSCESNEVDRRSLRIWVYTHASNHVCKGHASALL